MPVKDHFGRLPASVRSWGKTVVILGGALAAYVAMALLVTLATGDAILAAAVSDLTAGVLAIAYRWRSTRTPLAGPPRARALTAGFWLVAAAGLVACWFAGQTAAAWVYATWGSSGFDAVNATKLDAPAWLVVITALILAPLGEESLIRGIAFPALRRHWTPLLSAFVTAMIFALMHGNMVQIVLTVPLGVLLAFVYEACQRLWPCVIMHVVFNMAASFVPGKLIAGIAHPVMVAAFGVVVVLLLFALTPGRYAGRDNEDAAATA